MARTADMARFEENGLEEPNYEESVSWDDLERDAASKAGGSSERLQARRPHQQDSSRKGDESPGELYELWRQEQNSIAARLDKELKSRWELDELIEEQLSRYQSHYYKAMVSTSLQDVSNLLMPMWLPPHELAAVSWLGDWRPTSILDLLRILAAHNPSFSLSESSERVLSQLLREIRIEEAVIDEEYAEIQATCVLHLPFSPLCNVQSHEEALRSVQKLFGNIHKVISKAQRLRYKVLELVMKKLLNQTDTAEFVVAFAGIQDAIHQFGEQKKLKKLYPAVPLKGLGSSS
ncbi:hypothetical protein EUTSA_v10008365mg [Eutrema salsugineum]|uniref:DOG1 domain-containing protein n=1 Tax=Eutrema salsugineum TaxID=72664 RepID=V4KC35_EUTSA|nr:protein DOG1-like 4 [Eutrema salsugineum]ESQ35275.1 hypothetical protein EUTSA_v10008365mg [Eutrema salsugineum]